LALVFAVEQSTLATQWRGHDLVGQRFAAAFPAAQVSHLLGVKGGGIHGHIFAESGLLAVCFW
jgi:hypothetical protein